MATTWSPDGKEIAVPFQSRPHFYDGETGKRLRATPERGIGGIGRSTLRPDGKRLLFKQDGDPHLREFDTETGTILERHDAPGGNLLASDPEHRWHLYVGGKANEYTLQHQSGKLHTLTGDPHHWGWRSSPRGTQVAELTGKRVRVWDTKTGMSPLTLDHPEQVGSVAWSPDGKRLATVAADKQVRVWDVAAGKVLSRHKDFLEAPNMVSESPGGIGGGYLAWHLDGRRLWVACGLSIVSLDTVTGRVSPAEKFSNGNSVGNLALAPDGDRLLVTEGYW